MGKIKQFSTNLDQIPKLAKKITKFLAPRQIYGLSGTLGSGKTTLVREVMRSLGFEGKVTSPSFSLINRYKVDYGSIKYVYHIDLYRLNNADAVGGLGLEDILNDEHAVLFVEWPDLLESEFDSDRYIKIFFDEKAEVKI